MNNNENLRKICPLHLKVQLHWTHHHADAERNSSAGASCNILLRKHKERQSSSSAPSLFFFFLSLPNVLINTKVGASRMRVSGDVSAICSIRRSRVPIFASSPRVSESGFVSLNLVSSMSLYVGPYPVFHRLILQAIRTCSRHGSGTLKQICGPLSMTRRRHTRSGPRIFAAESSLQRAPGGQQTRSMVL